eukprot:TRINITY_DN16050_c0_g1_i1.p1 TRINITY_DN16050_c0_g1~~TRINITY_DN16050_c0_g1_i1.p1  ORF type:complete len:381 (+),score=116.11 TRINITY_DN16050_c0_g1_i1:219-1361(+)
MRGAMTAAAADQTVVSVESSGDSDEPYVVSQPAVPLRSEFTAPAFPLKVDGGFGAGRRSGTLPGVAAPYGADPAQPPPGEPGVLDGGAEGAARPAGRPWGPLHGDGGAAGRGLRARDPGLSEGPLGAEDTVSTPASLSDIDQMLEGLTREEQVAALQRRLHEVSQRNTRFRSENARLRAEQQSLTEKVRLAGTGDAQQLRAALQRTQQTLSDERKEHSMRKVECDELRARLSLMQQQRPAERPGDSLGELRALLEEEHEQDMQACSDYYEERLQEMRHRLQESESGRQRERDYAESLQERLHRAQQQQLRAAPEWDEGPTRRARSAPGLTWHAGQPGHEHAQRAEDLEAHGPLVKHHRRKQRVSRRGERGACEMCTCSLM